MELGGCGKSLSIDSKIAVLLLLLTSILSIEQILAVESILLLVCIIKKKLKLRSSFLLLLVMLCLHGCINIITGDDTFDLMIKQLLGIGLSFVYFDTATHDADKHVLFDFYLKIALIMSLLVIVQQLAFILKIEKIYDLSWLFKRQLFAKTMEGNLRASGFFAEPAACATAMTPAMYIAIIDLIRKNTTCYKYHEAVLVLLGYILTYSSVGYISIGIALILLATEYKINHKAWLAIGIMVLVIIALYTKIPSFRIRVDDTLKIIQNGTIGNENLSSVTITANQKVAYKTFLESHGFGTGIGSYRIDYDKFINQVVNSSFLTLRLNREDANSLFLRITAELGILGILAIVVFLIKYRVKENFTPEKSMSNALLLYILTRLLRSGHYFHNSLYFFVIMYMEVYYLSKRKTKNELQTVQLPETTNVAAENMTISHDSIERLRT